MAAALGRALVSSATGLAAATALGAALALAPALRPPAAPGVGDAAALVNGRPIERAEFERALAALANDKRNPVSDEDRLRALDRLIEEELLIQRGVEIGLVDRDRAVRSALVAAMIQHVLAEVEAAPPAGEDALRAWARENADFLRPQPRLRVRAVQLRGDPAAVAAFEADLRAGAAFDALAAAHGEETPFAPPDALLPPSKLKDYVGGPAASELAQLEAGAWLGPRSYAGGVAFYHLVERQEAAALDFETRRGEIERAYRRARGDEAFRDYLAWLERRGEVVRGREGAPE